MEASAATLVDRQALKTAMYLSLGVGLLMFVMKVGAYLLTGSAAILSDAAESVVHVAAVIFATFSLHWASKPADASHLYGHAKISFFSAGFEGAMIFCAALFIIYAAIEKWVHGLQLSHLGWGTGLTALATLINGGLGAYLLWVGRRKRSLILEADGKHVLTDCWTSLAVLVGLGLTKITGWLPWDPICGIVVAINILVSGIGLIRSAFSGLMDVADPAAQKQLVAALDQAAAQHGISYHELRHRNVGDAYWVEVHLVFPESTPLQAAHRVATAIEQELGLSVQPRAYVTTHLECASDHDEVHPPATPH